MIFSFATGRPDTIIHYRCCCEVFKSSLKALTRTSCIVENILAYWRRKWQPAPVHLPGEFHGQRSLAGYGPKEYHAWVTELDTTE